MNEVAILLPESNVISKDHNRYITVNYKQKPNDYKQLKFIPDCHRSYDPLMHPLIFRMEQIDGMTIWVKQLQERKTQTPSMTMQSRKSTFVLLVT